MLLNCSILNSVRKRIDESKQMHNYSNYVILPNEGLIYSLKTNRFIGNKGKKGYWQCTLYGDKNELWNTTIHRIVYTAVNGVIQDDMQVNHIDENPSNNSIENLNLLSCRENCNWGTHNKKLSKALKGRVISIEAINKRNNTIQRIVGAYKDGVLHTSFPIKNCISFGYSNFLIKLAINNQKQYRGYEWRYI